MDVSNNKKVNDYLIDIESVFPERIATILKIRKYFLEADKYIKDDIKYGGLVFYLNDVLIGGIFSYKKHMSIEFSSGADFSDPDGFLEGGGKRRRHLKINLIDDVDNKNSRFYIKQTAA